MSSIACIDIHILAQAPVKAVMSLTTQPSDNPDGENLFCCMLVCLLQVPMRSHTSPSEMKRRPAGRAMASCAKHSSQALYCYFINSSCHEQGLSYYECVACLPKRLQTSSPETKRSPAGSAMASCAEHSSLSHPGVFTWQLGLWMLEVSF